MSPVYSYVVSERLLALFVGFAISLLRLTSGYVLMSLLMQACLRVSDHPLCPRTLLCRHGIVTPVVQRSTEVQEDSEVQAGARAGRYRVAEHA